MHKKLHHKEDMKKEEMGMHKRKPKNKKKEANNKKK